jgi:competence protein ComEC
VDVLLAPHHGRDAGFCEDLFKYFKPRLTIVSDGSICDTSARDRYRTHSSGWKVYGNNGDGEVRYCLTTGSDGTVRVSMGRNPDGGSFLHVRIYR